MFKFTIITIFFAHNGRHRWSVVARGATFKLLRETLESPEFYRKGTLGYLYRMPTISSRISKLSYGIEYGIEYSGPEPCVNPPFDRSIDRVTIDPDGKMAVWRMKWFLRKVKHHSSLLCSFFS